MMDCYHNKYKSREECANNLEGEGLVEDWVKRLPVHLGLKLLLFVREEVDFHIWIRSARHVHSRQVSRLDHTH